MNTIDVYLDDHSYQKDDIWNLLIDFRTKEDFDTFISAGIIKELSVKPVSTYFWVYDYRTTESLVGGSYYKLDLDVLSNAKARIDKEYLYFFASFSFKNNEDSTVEPLLSGRNYNFPNISTGIDVESFQEYKDFDDVRVCLEHYNPKCFYVFDVGQGSWNSVIGCEHGGSLFSSRKLYCRVDCSTFGVKLVFDMGCDLNYNKNKVNDLLTRYTSFHHNSKSILVISHWDLDHYRLLLALTEENINDMFCYIICPSKVVSNTSISLLNRLTGKLGRGRVIPINNPPRNNNGASLNSIFNSGFLNLYIGCNYRNINKCGIVLLLNGSQKSVLFTGDSSYKQLSVVLNNGSSINGDLFFVIPHHGGNDRTLSPQFNPVNVSEAIISVGRNNRYNHPSRTVLSFFRNRGIEIYRTDDSQTFVDSLD